MEGKEAYYTEQPLFANSACFCTDFLLQFSK